MAEGQEINDPSANNAMSLSESRREFVEGLGRRVEGLREALGALKREPAQAGRRDTLLRRVHALGSAARVLGFASAAEALLDAERALSRSLKPPVLDDDLARVERMLDLLPTLVHSAGVSAVRTGVTPGPLSILVVGSSELAKALTEKTELDLECMLADSPRIAAERAQLIDPDVIVVDCDADFAREVLAQLRADSAAASIPIVAVATLEGADDAAKWVALGATSVIAKPITSASIQSAVVKEVVARAHEAAGPVGEATLEEVAERLGAELRRGLVDATTPQARSTRVAFGEGAELLAAVWGAVARVRQLVTERSAGSIRFEPTGPEGGLPVVAWTSERRSGRSESAAVPTDTLQGRTVLIVDDDPAVVWFLSGALKSMGAKVLEAHDGSAALEAVQRQWPDLVVSDVIMPGLDGISLCREIKRDAGIRDVPVILLSWKEDLLQRVRELGADADGYLRKEAPASTVMERVRDALRPRTRVEERLKGKNEVSGRLDGLSPRLILKLTALVQRDARVTLRDPAFVYEIQIRDGAVRSITRTGKDGNFERGTTLVAPLLGVNSGRFTVTPDESPCRSDVGDGFEIAVDAAIERARGVQRTLATRPVTEVQRVAFDSNNLAGYLDTTPEPARGLLRQLVDGVSPAELCASQGASPRLIEDLLSDLARRGAVTELEMAVVKPATKVAEEPAPKAVEQRAPAQAAPEAAQEPAVAATEPKKPDEPPAQESSEVSKVVLPPVPIPPRASPPDTAGPAAAVFTFALTPELPMAAHSPAPTATVQSASAPAAPLPVGTTQNDASVDSGWDSVDSTDLLADSKASSAPVPEVKPTEKAVWTRPEHGTLPGVGTAGRKVDAVGVELSEAIAGIDGTPSPAPADAARSVDTKTSEAPPTKPEARTEPVKRSPKPDESPAAPGVATVPQPGVASPPPSSLRGVARVVGAFLAALITSFALVRLVVPLASKRPDETAPPAAASAPAPLAASASASTGIGTAATPKVDQLGLPPGIPPVPPDKGLLEVFTGDDSSIYEDGAFIGRGPLRRDPVTPAEHEIVVRKDGQERRIRVEIRAGARTRVSYEAAEAH